MSEDMREKIMSVAIHMFAHRGYGGTSVRELVEGAGVTKPTLYYWFESKEALYVECVTHSFAIFRNLAVEAAALPLSPAARIEAFLTRYLEMGLANLDLARLAITATHPSIERRPEIDIMSMHLQYITPLEQLITQGVASGEFRPVNPQFATIALIGIATMQLQGAMHGMPQCPNQGAAAAALFLKGVEAK